MMVLDVLGTGSGGNAYILHAGKSGDAMLLDAGLSYMTIVRRAAEINGKGLRGVSACLVTHEHNDHVKATNELANIGIDVYATKGTFEAACIDMNTPRVRTVELLKPFSIGGFMVLPFPTQHDAKEPCGFLIRYSETGETLLYATDTYYLRNTFPGVNYWLVECNYVDDVLNEQMRDGEVPVELRNRLLSSHMSLRRLKDTLVANDLTDTRVIVLCHLSDGRSSERQMIDEIHGLTGVEVVAASRGMRINLQLTPF